MLNPGAGVDDAATGDGAIAVNDAYLEYAGDFYSFVIGENNVTSPLEDRTSRSIFRSSSAPASSTPTATAAPPALRSW